MKPLILTLLLLLPIPAFGQAVWGNRTYNRPVCNNPNCGMCQSIRAQLQLQTSIVPSTAYNDLQYETVQVPVVTRVKRCNGVQCWYENVTTYRTERRPVRNAVKSVTNSLLRVTELVPTPYEAVTALMKLARPKSTDVLYDLGCGDGRVLIAATTVYGCKSVGIELNPETAEEAKQAVSLFQLQDRIKVAQGDVLDYTYPQATLVTVYLYPELIEKLIPLLPSGCRVISYIHEIPGGTKHVIDGHVFYEWVKP